MVNPTYVSLHSQKEYGVWKVSAPKSITVSFDNVPAGATIDSVTLSFTNYGGSGTLWVNDTELQITSSNMTQRKVVELQKVINQTVTVKYLFAGYSTGTQQGLDLNSIQADISFNAATKPGPVTSAQLAKTVGTEGEFVGLTWGHVTANPPVRHYVLEYADKLTSGVEYSNWQRLQNVTGIETYVAAPAEGYTRRFRIAAVSMDDKGNMLQGDWYQVNSTLSAVGQGQETEQQPVNNMMPYRVVHIWRRIR